MTSKERVLAAIAHRETDRVPVGDWVIDYPIVERVLGRKTYVRSHAQLVMAYWEGKRDEVVKTMKRDYVEFIQRTGLDIAHVSLVPPRNWEISPPRRIDERTWEDAAGNMVRYFEETQDIMVIRPADPPRPTPHQPEPDGSEWEYWDYIVEKLGKTHFICGSVAMQPPTGVSYPGTGNKFQHFESRMIALAEHPERIAANEVKSLDGRRALVRRMKDRGLDGAIICPNYGYGSGPYCSPSTFRKAFLPGLKKHVEETHASGLPLILHCDANLREVIDQVVEAGVDIYQAIQTQEKIDDYKRRFGHHITLWGGVDAHDLCTASPDEIHRQATEAMHRCAPGGGFILGSSHNVLLPTTYENFMAMVQAAFGS